MKLNRDIVERIRSDRADLSRAYGAIADFLDAEPEKFIREPIRRLSDAIGVSEPTLIRFSRHFGFNGFPDLRLAAAMSLAANDRRSSRNFEPRQTDKEEVNREVKEAIAAAAFPLVAADTSVLLDSGSTVKCLAERLATAQPLTIFTTGLVTLMALQDCGQHRLILAGGEFRPAAMALGGRLAESALSGLSFDTVYLGADSIHPEFGLSTFSEEEAHLNRAMIRASRRIVVLADASKFRTPSFHRICDLSEIDILVTDSGLDAAEQAAIARHGPRIMLADASAARQPGRGTS